MKKGIYLVGIDVGTTSCRTIVFDTGGRCISKATVEYSVRTPHPGWAEQDPDEWWAAAVQTLEKAVGQSGVSPSDIAALGVTGQQPSPVFLGQDGRVLTPSLIWMDRRTAEECQRAEQVIGREKMYRLTGLRIDPTYAAYKIMWVRDHLPQVFADTWKVLQPKDFIIYRLTGEVGVDFASAAAAQLLDLTSRAWSEDLLKALGIPRRILPDLSESTTLLGKLRKDAAEAAGLAEGTPVVCGAGDTTVSAIGSRVVAPGRASVNIGTSSDVMACLQEPAFDPKMRIGLYPHALPRLYVAIAGANTAGMCLRWFRDAFCGPERDAARSMGVDVYDVMNIMAKDLEPGGGGLIFLPYLLGERSPLFDPLARGMFFGVSLNHTKGSFIRAIMEGVAFSIRHRLDVVEHLKSELALPTLVMSGGAAKSPVWRQIVADINGKTVQTLASEESTCMGSALLAGLGVGLYSDILDACDQVMPVVGEMPPISEHRGVYEPLYRKYQDLYNSTRHLAAGGGDG